MKHKYISFKRELASYGMEKLIEDDIVNRDMKIFSDDNFVYIPLTEFPENIETLPGFVSTGEREFERRNVNKKPFLTIKEACKNAGIPQDCISEIPNRWELFGNVCIINIPECLLHHEKKIGEIYSKVLNAETVMNRTGIISGETRKPNLKMIYGTNPIARYIENGIIFTFDTRKLMFSKGNKTERMRITSKIKKGEKVWDMFAGIGYFSLPIAVYSEPDKIVSTEINSISYEYLVKNAKLNNAENIEAINIDNRQYESYSEKFDHIIMGYLHETYSFLPYAIRSLKNGGWIHYHTVVNTKEYKKNAFDEVNSYLKANYPEKMEVVNITEYDVTEVKSYAPCLSHVVMDFRLKIRN